MAPHGLGLDRLCRGDPCQSLPLPCNSPHRASWPGNGTLQPPHAPQPLCGGREEAAEDMQPDQGIGEMLRL